MKGLVDVRYSEAEVIRVVRDNLNAHAPGSLYEAFAPAAPSRLVEKLRFHSTPQHGSWLTLAEIELRLRQRQCVSRRLADEGTLKREVAAWERQRHSTQETIDWRFSSTEAREKLKRLYPTYSLR